MSMSEVAKKAGVSQSTVSRVINDVPGVNEELKEKVLLAMDELQYRPSPRRPGRTPQKNWKWKTRNILLLVAGHDTSQIFRMPIFPSILHGLESALSESGFNLVFASARKNQSVPFSLNDYKCDGIVLLGSTESMPTTILQEIQTIPTILVLKTVDQLPGPFDRVLYSNESVGTIAAEYLLERGHKNMAFLMGVADSEHPAYFARKQYFGNILKQAGASVINLQPESHDPHSYAWLKPQIQNMVAQSPRPSGIFVANDALLPALYGVLSELNITPQKDLDIISCDNEVNTLNTLDVRPASIDIGPDLVGRHAIRQLFWRITNPDDQHPVTIMIEPKLIPAS